MPTLILQGQEDLRTPPEVSAHVATLIAGTQRVTVPGVGHAIVGADPSGCGRRRLLRFVAGDAVRSRCPRVQTDVPATGVPPASFAALAPAAGLSGRVGRTVSAVDATLDFLDFALSPALNVSASGGGLRGGSYHYGRRLSLRGVVVAPGVRISGRERSSGTLKLRVRGREAARGKVRVTPARAAERPARRPAGRRTAGQPPAAAVRVRGAGGDDLAALPALDSASAPRPGTSLLPSRHTPVLFRAAGRWRLSFRPTSHPSCGAHDLRAAKRSTVHMSTDPAGKARDTALQGALAQIERQFGKGTVMRMGDEGAQVRVDAIPTGALSLDLALGIGGMPRGRIVEVFGPESSGKTTLVYHVIAEAQKLGGVCAFIDAEHAMDPLYAQNLGVNIDELLVSQPDYGEQGLEVCDMLVRSGAVDLVAIDSVAALTPRAELEGQMGDQTVGVQARMMSQAMRKLAGNLNRTQTLCLFVNQIREKVGVMFGSPETQPGGRALKFYSSQRLDIRRIETLKDGTEAVGNRVRVKVVKNKVAAPFRQAEFDIEFGKGISSSGCILDLAIEHDVVTKSGSFFSYGEDRLGQGRNNAKAYLDEHLEVAKEIEAKIYVALGIGQDLVTPIERSEPVESLEAVEAAAAAA